MRAMKYEGLRNLSLRECEMFDLNFVKRDNIMNFPHPGNAGDPLYLFRYRSVPGRSHHLIQNKAYMLGQMVYRRIFQEVAKSPFP